MPEQEVTLCQNCVHFLNMVSAEDRPKDKWYEHFCQATRLPEATDPSDGQLKHVGTHYQGGKYFTHYPYELCIRVNNGHCAKYKKNEGEIKSSESGTKVNTPTSSWSPAELINLFEMAVRHLNTGSEVLRELYVRERVPSRIPVLIQDTITLFISGEISMIEAHHRLQNEASRIRRGS